MKMLEDFPMKFKDFKERTHPVGMDMFKEDLTKKLGMAEREMFHHFVARILCV